MMIDNQEFRRKTIARSSLAVGIVLASTITVRVIAVKHTWSYFFIYLFPLLMLLIPWLIKRGFSTNGCAYLLLLIFNGAAIFGGIYNGGIMAPGSVVYIFLPLIGFLTLGKRGAVFAISLSFFSIILMNILQHLELVIPFEYDPSTYMNQRSFLHAAAACLSYVMGWSYELSRNSKEKLIADINLKAALSVKMASLGEMAGGVAHEINNPLTIIDGKIRQMKRKISAGEVDQEMLLDELNKLEKTVGRIVKIVRGLSSFSRNDEADPMRAVEVELIIEDSLELCREKLKNDDVELTVNCPPGLTIECRPSQISQIILNLLSNAQDAIRGYDNKWIRIDVTTGNQQLSLRVTDCGMGITPRVAAKMMEPFFTTKEVGKGTGLGLSVSLGVAQTHRGELYYDSEAANTSFVLELPLKQVL